MLDKYQAVGYELLRPAEAKARREAAPIAYIVAGSLEWHGKQNPLGTDSLKAHAICCEAALRHGGVVLPPYFQGLLGERGWGPEGWEGYTLGHAKEETFEAAITGIARALVTGSWKVIVGVTGHDVDRQRDAMQRAIAAATDGHDATGFAIKEGELHTPDDDLPYRMDHAGAWETSCMMYVHPDRVDLDEIRDSPLADRERWEMKECEGIGGLNPLTHASPELGRKIIERMGDLIGAKARGLLREATGG